MRKRCSEKVAADRKANNLSAKKTVRAGKPQISLWNSRPKPQSLLLSCRTLRLLQWALPHSTS